MLSLVPEDDILLLHLLQTLQPTVNETTAPVAKKARLDGLGPFRDDVAIPLANELI